MTNHIQTVFISGANRGIGNELAQQLTQQSYMVIAGYREESRSALLLNQAQENRHLVPFKVHVGSESDLNALYEFIAQRFGYLDMLINNAAANLNRSLTLNDLTWADMTHHLDVNVGGPFLTAKHLYPLLKTGQGKKIVNISSRLGSIATNSGSSIPYSLSKAALNMLTKQQANAYRADGIAVISLSPGWVQTDMGGRSAPLTVQESVRQIVQRIAEMSLAQSGAFLNVDGERIPY